MKAVSGSKRTSRSKKDKNAPRKCRTAYIFYTEETRAALKEENPEAGFGELSKLAGERWKVLSAEEKGKYEGMAERDKERYTHEMLSYRVPEDHDVVHEAEEEEEDEPSKGKKKKKTKRDKNAPKGALSAYFVYSAELRDQIREENPEMSLGGIAKMIGARWRDLTPEDKAHYEEKSKLDKERYNIEMRNYLAVKASGTEIPDVHVDYDEDDDDDDDEDEDD